MRKKVLRRSFYLLVAFIVSVSSILHSLAVAATEVELSGTDAEKMEAFLHQETALHGVLNGDACYHADIPEGAGTTFGGSYSGGSSSPLIDYDSDGIGKHFMLSFSIWVFGQIEMPGSGTLYWDDWNWPVCPDFYGPLDLSETSFTHVENRHNNHTHITSICVDNCPNMRWVDVSAQPFCTELSALGCPNLSQIIGCNTALTNIRIQPRMFTTPLVANAFGNGIISELNFNEQENNELILGVNEDNESFLGWFENGVLVSTSARYAVVDGGNISACFGGDANEDGNISVADAVIALRGTITDDTSMNVSLLDIDGDDSITIVDVIMIARFALGLLY